MKRWEDLLRDQEALQRRIMETLHEASQEEYLIEKDLRLSPKASAVLFLLNAHSVYDGSPPKPCVVLNKRSRKVRQPGDLCFPGGRISPGTDLPISRLLRLPLFPLSRWPYWNEWRERRGNQANDVSLLLATGLRESLEEMGLNPLGVKFLGPLPAETLLMFGRIIYPMVGWIGRQRRFLTNWEVEKVVHVPLGDLLDLSRYGLYRLLFRAGGQGVTQDFPCFALGGGADLQVLWGATYRIIMSFLDIVFDFRPPDPASLPVIHGTRGESYLNGAKWVVGEDEEW